MFEQFVIWYDNKYRQIIPEVADSLPSAIRMGLDALGGFVADGFTVTRETSDDGDFDGDPSDYVFTLFAEDYDGLLLAAYNRYIQRANDENRYADGWRPVSISEYAESEEFVNDAISLQD